MSHVKAQLEMMPGALPSVMQAKTRSSRRLQVNFGDLRHIIGSKWLYLGDNNSWSPGRLSAGLPSGTDGASQNLWGRTP